MNVIDHTHQLSVVWLCASSHGTGDSEGILGRLVELLRSRPRLPDTPFGDGGPEVRGRRASSSELATTGGASNKRSSSKQSMRATRWLSEDATRRRIAIWSRSSSGSLRANIASSIWADTLLSSWCLGGWNPRLPHELLSGEVKDTVGLQSLDQDPQLQDAISREQSQRHGLQTRARTLTLKTDARGRGQVAQRSRTHKNRAFFFGQWLLVWQRQVHTSNAHEPRVRRDRWIGPAAEVHDGVGEHASTTVEVHDRPVATGFNSRRRRSRLGIQRRLADLRDVQAHTRRGNPSGVVHVAREGPYPA